MDRTKNRPMPLGKVSVVEALVFSSVIGIIGILSLWQLNPLSAILGVLALASYVLIYTPLKTITPLSVFVGAFPGSVPPMLGYVAASGGFGLEAGILFLTQFFWQFPHFWSIAWKLHDDYQKGGFWMLPSLGGRDKKSAYQILLYTAALIPVGMLPWVIDMTGIVSAVIAIIFGILMCVPAYKLYKTLDTKFAKQLMFGSFLYLPLMLIVYLIDKI
jgi:protoheme IX farnesyltransferase